MTSDFGFFSYMFAPFQFYRVKTRLAKVQQSYLCGDKSTLVILHFVILRAGYLLGSRAQMPRKREERDWEGVEKYPRGCATLARDPNRELA